MSNNNNKSLLTLNGLPRIQGVFQLWRSIHTWREYQSSDTVKDFLISSRCIRHTHCGLSLRRRPTFTYSSDRFLASSDWATVSHTVLLLLFEEIFHYSINA